MIRLRPRSTRTDALFPYTTLFRSILDAPYEAPIGLAAIHLVARATVDGDELCAEILGDVREFGGVEAVVAPAHAHLDRHRHLPRLDAGLDQRRGEFQVAHPRRDRKSVVWGTSVYVRVGAGGLGN